MFLPEITNLRSEPTELGLPNKEATLLLLETRGISEETGHGRDPGQKKSFIVVSSHSQSISREIRGGNS